MFTFTKQYLVFGFDSYYPRGGWNDFVASFDSLTEAMSDADKAFKTTYDHVQVIDSVDGQVVFDK